MLVVSWVLVMVLVVISSWHSASALSSLAAPRKLNPVFAETLTPAVSSTCLKFDVARLAVTVRTMSLPRLTIRCRSLSSGITYHYCSGKFDALSLRSLWNVASPAVLPGAVRYREFPSWFVFLIV